MARARRSGAPQHLALLDIDHLKRFNDTNGHQAGDLLLKSAAASWKAQLREGDMLARYGGEEFAALLVGCSQVEAVVILDRVREATPLGENVSVGSPSGTASRRPSSSSASPTTPSTRAKHQGRNRVVATPSPAAQPGERSSNPIGSAPPS
jgi:diguanylate cyclase (GGDEF)-like protein